MKKSVVIMALALLLNGIILVSCSGGNSAKSVTASETPITAVKATVEKQRNAMGSFKTSPLNGGTAVLSSRDWAYWVKDGQVYAANGLAMGASPNIPKAPVGVGFSEIENAVKGIIKPVVTSGVKYDIPKPPERFTLGERKTIRAESSQVTAEAQAEAERMYPMSDAQGRTIVGNLEKNAELSGQLTAKAEKALIEKYGLEKNELLAILMER